MADVKQTITERSSIRAYKPDTLSKETVSYLIDTALMAPTAINKQEIFVTAISTSNPVVAEIQQALNPAAANTFYYGAPMLFVLSGDDSFKWSTLDAGIAVENMHLAARELGLGSVVLGCINDVMHGEKAAYFNEKLGIPTGYSFRIALAAGYPDTEKVPHSIDKAKNSIVID